LAIYRNWVSASVLPALSWLFEVLPSLGDNTFQEPETRQSQRQRAGDMNPSTVLVVTGLVAEARIAAGADIHVVTGGCDGAHLKAQLEKAVRPNISGIVSFGIAGGLAPGVKPGTPLVARGIITERDEYFECHRGWSQKLAKALGDVPIVDMAGIDLPVADPAGKRALHVATRAAAADTESHIAARIAARHHLPFAAFRVVADPAERHLPHAALVGVRQDGELAIGRVLRSLMSDPRQLPHLFRTALDARAAFDALFRSREMIAGGFSFLDFGELMLDVPREDVIGGSLTV
jgi:adenosylhomocysteine nucleosidase